MFSFLCELKQYLQYIVTSSETGFPLFWSTTYFFTAYFRYLLYNGSYSSNIKIITSNSNNVNPIDNQQSLQNILNRCYSLHNYSPTYLTAFDFHGFINTAFPVIIRKIYQFFFSNINYYREKLILTDGGTVALDYAYLSNNYENKTDKQSTKNRMTFDNQINDASPIVIIHPGLCGDSQSEYITHIAEKLLKENYRVVVFIVRGCGGLHLTNMKTFSASRMDDLEQAINHIHAVYPRAKSMYGLSYSLGAGIMLNYLGKCKNIQLDGAICVSPAWNFMISTKVYPIVDSLLALSIKLYAISHRAFLKLSVWNCIQIFLTLSSYNLESFFLHLHGYRSVEEYYMDSSACFTSHNINCKTLAISAEDDPVCCHSGISTDHIGSGLAVIKTLTGGHLGFAENTFSASNWIETISLEWFRMLSNYHEAMVETPEPEMNP